MATIKRKSSAAKVITAPSQPSKTTAEHIVPAVTPNILHSVSLHCTTGNSDKIYEIRIAETTPGEFSLYAMYGRRGATSLNTTHKGMYASLAAAKLAFDTLLNEKVAKGYVIVKRTDSTSVASTAVATASLGPRPPKLIAKTHSCDVHGHRLLLTSTGSSSSARTFVTCQYAGRSDGACSLRPYPLGEHDVDLTCNGKYPLIVGVVVSTLSKELEADSVVHPISNDKMRTDTLVLRYHDAKASWHTVKNSLLCEHDDLRLVESAAHTRVKCSACHMMSSALPDAMTTHQQGSTSLYVVQTQAGCLDWVKHAALGRVLRRLKLVSVTFVNVTPKTHEWRWQICASDDTAQVAPVEPVVENIASDDVLHACDHALLMHLEDDTPYVRCTGACQSTWLIRNRPIDPASIMLLVIQGSYRKLVTRMALTLREETVTEQVGKTKIKDGTRWRCSSASVSACRKNNNKLLYEKHFAGLTADTPINTLLGILQNKMRIAVDDWREEQKVGGSLFGGGAGTIKRRK